MTALREAAQQALEALERSRVFVTTQEKIKHPEGTEWYDENITALRDALAQEAQEQEDIAQNLQSRLDAALLLEQRRQELSQELAASLTPPRCKFPAAQRKKLAHWMRNLLF
jgi:hypothetical protein